MSDKKPHRSEPAFGSHKDGSYYLRATSPDQAGAIQDAAEKHGIALSHRKGPALHEGKQGVFSHFHFTNPDEGQKIIEELRTLHEAGTAEPADDAAEDLAGKEEGGAAPAAPAKETHVHVHLHEGGEASERKEAEGEAEDEKHDERPAPAKRPVKKSLAYMESADKAADATLGAFDALNASTHHQAHTAAARLHQEAARQASDPEDVHIHQNMQAAHAAALSYQPGHPALGQFREVVKSHIQAHTRRINGKVVQVHEYDDNRAYQHRKQHIDAVQGAIRPLHSAEAGPKSGQAYLQSYTAMNRTDRASAMIPHQTAREEHEKAARLHRGAADDLRDSRHEHLVPHHEEAAAAHESAAKWHESARLHFEEHGKPRKPSPPQIAPLKAEENPNVVSTHESEAKDDPPKPPHWSKRMDTHQDRMDLIKEEDPGHVKGRNAALQSHSDYVDANVNALEAERASKDDPSRREEASQKHLKAAQAAHNHADLHEALMGRFKAGSKKHKEIKEVADWYRGAAAGHEKDRSILGHPIAHSKTQAAQEASEKAHTISGKEPVDHEAAEAAHSLARTAHLEARGPLGPMGTPEDDPHGHAAALHQERMLHHREAHQTTVQEAIGDTDRKNGNTEATYQKAATEANRHSKGLDMGGGMAPTAENHYAAHEAHTAAAAAAREHAKVDPAYTAAAERHEKDASWHKFLGDSKMKAREKGAKVRKVSKGLDSYLDSADLLSSAQRWHVSRLNSFHLGMAPADLPAFAAVKQSIQDAAHKGLGHDQVMDTIYMATGGASAYTQAVLDWLQNA